MATNERMSSIKQAPTMKGDTHMTTTEQTTVHRSTTNGHAPATMQTPKSKRIVGASQRRAEILIATLFLVSAVTSFLGMFVLDPILKASDYLARIFPVPTGSTIYLCGGFDRLRLDVFRKHCWLVRSC